MADSDSQDDKTLDPTEKRLREAREEGQVPRSRELAGATMALACCGLALAMAGPFGERLVAVLRDALAFDLQAVEDAGGPVAHFAAVAIELLLIGAPLIAAGLVAAIAGTLALGGLNFAPKALAPKIERIDPVAGFKRLYSLPALGEVAKSLLRVGVVGAVAFVALYSQIDAIVGLVAEPDHAGILHALSIVGWTLMALSASLGLIALLDVPFQWWRHRRGLRMSLEEVRREMKELEGSPEIKGRVRQLQREMAQRRMMEAVPGADVVLVNPTHYAVALKYEQGRMRAPRVVAKGQDLVALAIRELAERHKVPVVSAPPLARALYRGVQLGQEIPAELYRAVAQVLTFVYQLRVYRRHGGREPVLASIEVDEPPVRGG
ncbi:MAG: flagellar biosynthesis protein FlhB [Pseudomonadota bacterium]|jgi:flagellar biosynthetic protein FlhB